MSSHIMSHPPTRPCPCLAALCRSLQGNDPSTDFRAAGYLSLQNLLYMGQAHGATFHRLLTKSEGRRAAWEYPFAASATNVTFRCVGGPGGGGGLSFRLPQTRKHARHLPCPHSLPLACLHLVYPPLPSPAPCRLVGPCPLTPPLPGSPQAGRASGPARQGPPHQACRPSVPAAAGGAAGAGGGGGAPGGGCWGRL